jgi:hypothetical protein
VRMFSPQSNIGVWRTFHRRPMKLNTFDYI